MCVYIYIYIYKYICIHTYTHTYVMYVLCNEYIHTAAADARKMRFRCKSQPNSKNYAKNII